MKKWKITRDWELVAEDGEEPFTIADELPIDGVPEGVIVHMEDTGDLYLFSDEKKCWIRFMDFNW